MSGYVIPVGHQVCVSPTTNHRLPDTWDDPEDFKPGRSVMVDFCKASQQSLNSLINVNPLVCN